MSTLRDEMMSRMSGGFTVNGVKDAHTCSDCAGKSGKSFAKGQSRPPFHPNCRCTAH